MPLKLFCDLCEREVPLGGQGSNFIRREPDYFNGKKEPIMMENIFCLECTNKIKVKIEEIRINDDSKNKDKKYKS